MVVQINDSEKIIRIEQDCDVEELINFVSKMGYIRGWKIAARTYRKKKSMEGDDSEITTVLESGMDPIQPEEIPTEEYSQENVPQQYMRRTL